MLEGEVPSLGTHAVRELSLTGLVNVGNMVSLSAARPRRHNEFRMRRGCISRGAERVDDGDGR